MRHKLRGHGDFEDDACQANTELTLLRATIRWAISIKTVSTYRARLLDKLHLKKTTDLFRYAVTNEVDGAFPDSYAGDTTTCDHADSREPDDAGRYADHPQAHCVEREECPR